MRVALFTTFKASRKDPLAGVLERIHAAFLAGPGAPAVRFVMADAPLPGFVSSVDRVLKRFPDMARFLSDSSLIPNVAPVRHLGNGPTSPVAGEQADFATILAIAAGVPRSFPFHNISIQFQHPAFGEPTRMPSLMHSATPGIIISDSWWVNGRNRSVSGYTIVDADVSKKKLPPLPESVATVFAACGKAKITMQTPFATGAAETPVSPNPEANRAAAEIFQNYKARFSWIVEHLAWPHDLPPAIEVIRSSLGMTPGPKKPALDNAFKPMGYSCKGGSGTFTLRRRTETNLTVELDLDVGTWSNNLTAMFRVQGLGFGGTLILPVSKRSGAMQYPIGDAERWQKIVDNLAAIVTELDRTLVVDVEMAAGPSPEWYKPES